MNLSVFDLDHTLLKKNSSVEFCKYLYKKKKLSFFSVFQASLYYIRHIYLSLSLEELHIKIFKKLLCGMSLEDLEKDVSMFAHLNLGKLLYIPAVQRLKLAQELGHFTMILSSSPDFLVKILAEKFQVDEWSASRYQVDEDRCLVCVSSILQGNDKALCVQKVAKRLSILKKDITAYSDSHLDLSFLLASGVPVLVNPNSKLKRLSRGLGWEEI